MCTLTRACLLCGEMTEREEGRWVRKGLQSSRRHEGGLTQGISCESRKWLDSGHILNLGQSGFANGFAVACGKEKT